MGGAMRSWTTAVRDNDPIAGKSVPARRVDRERKVGRKVLRLPGVRPLAELTQRAHLASLA
jgi:hypothetical protein